MTVSIRHAKVSGQPAGSNPDRVYGTHWDEDHVVPVASTEEAAEGTSEDVLLTPYSGALLVDERVKLRDDYEQSNFTLVDLCDAIETGGDLATPAAAPYFNVIMGHAAETEGDLWRNVIIGALAGSALQECERTEAIGQGAMRFAALSQRNTAVGSLVMQWLGNDVANLADLYHDLFYPDHPDDPGWDAGGLETNNPGVGADLLAVTVAADTDAVRGNVGVGRDALLGIIKGTFNTGVGYRALTRGFNINNCTAVGRDSLRDNVFGDQNTALGATAGLLHQEGINNVYLGYSAGPDHILGEESIFIGFDAGDGWGDTDRSVLIGPQAGSGITEQDDAFVLMNDAARSPLIAGDFATGSVVVNGTPSQATYPLRVLGGTPVSGTANAAANTFVIEIPDATNGGMSIRGGTSSTLSLYFGDSGDNNPGGISYSHSSDTVVLRAADASRFSVSSTVAASVPPLQAPSMRLADTNASHHLVLAAGSDLSADRQLTITTGDVGRTLVIDDTAPGCGVFHYLTGRYYFPTGGSTVGSSTFVTSANVLYAVPIHISHDMTLAALVAQVTTGSAGAVRMGVYNDSSGYPGSLVVDAGTGDTTGTGTIEVATTQALSRGKYWIAGVFSATPTLRRFNGTATNNVVAIGYTTADPTGATDTITGVTVAYTYGALPSTFTGGGTYVASTAHPRFGFKA
jgi:hypothetical protein